jgi:hypothetical protein
MKVTDELLKEMERVGYSKDAIEYARVQLQEKKDMNFALHLYNELTSMMIAQTIFTMAENGDLDIEKQ